MSARCVVTTTSRKQVIDTCAVCRQERTQRTLLMFHATYMPRFGATTVDKYVVLIPSPPPPSPSAWRGRFSVRFFFSFLFPQLFLWIFLGFSAVVLANVLGG